jgi:FSR family fosmidomycin resistance protein-like MFS transporter
MLKTSRTLRRSALFVCLLLVIEFLDEVVFSAREAALPLIRDDLGLSYDQIGLLLSLPMIFASLVEPILFTLADVWRRKWIILGGGVLFGVELLVVALAQDFAVLLIAMFWLAPASGAFVSVSQAALMDTDPQRHESLMAKWTAAGSVGVVVGPLGLGAMIWLGGGWRGLFGLFALLTTLIILFAVRLPFPQHITEETPTSLNAGLRGVWRGLRDKNVLRWLILLDFSDLMLDVLLSYLALYMVDVTGVDAGRTGIAVAVWTGVGLLGDALLIPLLERVNGLTYLRFSVWIEMFRTFAWA